MKKLKLLVFLTLFCLCFSLEAALESSLNQEMAQLLPVQEIVPPITAENNNQGTEEVSFMMQMMNMFVTLGLLLSLVLLAGYVMKRLMRSRMQQANLTSHIKILEQRALTHKSWVTLIEIEDKKLAIAESTNGIILLCELDSNSPKEER